MSPAEKRDSSATLETAGLSGHAKNDPTPCATSVEPRTEVLRPRRSMHPKTNICIKNDATSLPYRVRQRWNDLSLPRRHAKDLWIILSLLTLAALPRLPDITSVGIRFDDESAYVRDARLWCRAIRAIGDRPFLSSLLHGNKAAAQDRLTQIGVDFSDRYLKPSQGFTFLGAGAMLLVGEGPHALTILNASAGMVSVVLLFFLAVPRLGVPVAAAGAGLLALSPYHVLYCRTAFTESTATLALVVALVYWNRARTSLANCRPQALHDPCPPSHEPTSARRVQRRNMFLCGLAMGWAATCHYRVALVPVAMAGWEIAGAAWRRWIARDREACVGQRLDDWGRALTGAIVPFLAIELFFQSARFLAWATDSYLPLLTYSEAAWRWGRVVADDPNVNEPGLIHPQVLAAFVQYYRHWHGTVATVLAGFGLALLLRRRWGLSAVSGFCLVLCGTLLLQGVAVVRAISFALPVLCLATAVAAAAMLGALDRVHRRAGIIGGFALALVLLIPSLSRLVELIPKRSMIAEACAPLSVVGGKAAVHHSGIYEAYTADRNIEFIDGQSFHRLGSPRDLLADLRAQGVRWVVTDPQIWHYRPWDHIFSWWAEFRALLDDEALPVAEFPHCRDYRWEFLAEGPGLKYLDEMTALNEGGIRIYELTSTVPGPLEVRGTTTLPSKASIPFPGDAAMETSVVAVPWPSTAYIQGN